MSRLKSRFRAVDPAGSPRRRLVTDPKRSEALTNPTVPKRESIPAARKRSPDLALLTLDDLRSYRRVLIQEENRISYWRRILHARLDLLSAGVTEGRGNARSLHQLLSNDRLDSGRQALISLLPVDDIPPLPELDRLWAREPAPGDAQDAAALVREMSQAERQISDYRKALHVRIAAATAELIARYRRSPADCLSALPMVPEQASPNES